MKYGHLLASFYFEPWNLRPDLHANFGRIFQEHLAGKATPEQVQSRPQKVLAVNRTGKPIVGPVDSWTGEPLVPQMAVERGVAIVPVWGVLGKRLTALDLMCGGCDYDYISEFARMALEDLSVHTVVFDVDSPGGMCRGLPECAAVISELTAVKRTISYSEGLNCSAAYYLSCACGEIYGSPSSSIGNVGTVLAAVDNSREWEMKGWRLELFASGALKAVGFDGKAWTDEERAFFRGWMLKKYAEFKAVVNASRPNVGDDMLDGRWLDGDLAETVGFTDGTANSLRDIVGAALMLGPKQP